MSTGSTEPAQSSILLAQLERVTWKILRNFLSFWSQPIWGFRGWLHSWLRSRVFFFNRVCFSQTRSNGPWDCFHALRSFKCLVQREGPLSPPSAPLLLSPSLFLHFILFSASSSSSSSPPSYSSSSLFLIFPPSFLPQDHILHWSCLRLCRLVGGGFQGPALFPTNVVQTADCACPGSGDDTYIRIDFLTHVTADALKNHT